jgi:hypothetical protein
MVSIGPGPFFLVSSRLVDRRVPVVVTAAIVLPPIEGHDAALSHPDLDQFGTSVRARCDLNGLCETLHDSGNSGPPY